MKRWSLHIKFAFKVWFPQGQKLILLYQKCVKLFAKLFRNRPHIGDWALLDATAASGIFSKFSAFLAANFLFSGTSIVVCAITGWNCCVRHHRLTETKGEADGEAAKPKGAVMDADVGDDE